MARRRELVVRNKARHPNLKDEGPQSMLTVKFTDASIVAIVADVERQLARGDIVTLTRLQILALLEVARE